MQIYTGMTIGTAAPTKSEMENFPHHMIAAVPPTTDFSCADYAEMAAPIVEDILARGRVPVFYDGTRLYLDAILYGDGLSDSTKNPAVLRQLPGNRAPTPFMGCLPQWVRNLRQPFIQTMCAG